MQVNPAILGKGIEFFVQNDELFAIVNGTTHPWHEVPEWVKAEQQQLLDADIQAQASLKKWGLDGDDALQQFTICTKGAFNHTPDLMCGEDSDEECFDCGHRGQCPYEGHLCKAIKCGEWVLGFREIQVIRLITNGLLDKQIADVLCISINTVTSHVANIRTKTGQPTRTAIAVWALEKGIN